MLGPMGMRRARRTTRAARGDAAVSDGRRHDRVRRRRRRRRGTCCRTSSRRERRTSATRLDSRRRATISTSVGMATVDEHEQALTALATAELLAISDVRIYGPPPARTQRCRELHRRRHPPARSRDDSRRGWRVHSRRAPLRAAVDAAARICRRRRARRSTSTTRRQTSTRSSPAFEHAREVFA